MNRRIILAHVPEDKLVAEDFAIEDAPIPSPGSGQLLVRTHILSLDPANRAWMQEHGRIGFCGALSAYRMVRVSGLPGE